MREAELMARLNPATVRYDIGRGGMPELTPSDIAAAIGMVEPGLGRELMCRLWWPAGAELSPESLDSLVTGLLMGEWTARKDALVMAQLKTEYATNERQRREAKQKQEEAAARMWPRIGMGSPYAAIRSAVLAEMSADCLCPACRGRAFLLHEGKLAGCKFCSMTGRAKVSDRARAEAIGVNRETYRLSVAPIYEWLLQACADALEPARKALGKRLA